MKKLISVLIVVVLLMSSLTVMAFATEGTPVATISGSHVEAEAGSTATVYFNVDNLTYQDYAVYVYYYVNEVTASAVNAGAANNGSFYSTIDNDAGSIKAATFSPNEMANASGSLFGVEFNVPASAKIGDKYMITISVQSVRNKADEYLTVAVEKGSITIVCDHDYKLDESTYKAPTCGDAGYEKWVCSCGDFYENHPAATGDHSHKLDESTYKAPTCGEAGYEKWVCSCGDSYENYPAATGDHDFEWKFDEDGHWKVCSECGEKVPGEQHVLKSQSTDGANCQTKGTVVYTCECGYTYTVYNEYGPHDYVSVVTDPTCTEKGYTTHTCSLCGDSYVDSYTDKVDHQWNNGKVTKKATCGEDGEMTYTCKHCGKTKTDVIPATGEHKYEWKYNDKQHWKECSVCGHKTKAEDHDFNWVTDKKPTKDEYGEKHEECECGCVRNEGTTIDKLKDDLDEVPDTGDITPHIVLGAAALIAMLAAVAYVFKRKAVK